MLSPWGTARKKRDAEGGGGGIVDQGSLSGRNHRWNVDMDQPCATREQHWDAEADCRAGHRLATQWTQVCGGGGGGGVPAQFGIHTQRAGVPPGETETLCTLKCFRVLYGRTPTELAWTAPRRSHVKVVTSGNTVPGPSATDQSIINRQRSIADCRRERPRTPALHGSCKGRGSDPHKPPTAAAAGWPWTNKRRHAGRSCVAPASLTQGKPSSPDPRNTEGGRRARALLSGRCPASQFDTEGAGSNLCLATGGGGGHFGAASGLAKPPTHPS